MGWFTTMWRRQLKKQEVYAEYAPPADEIISDSLLERLAWFRSELERCDDVVYREFVDVSGQHGVVIFIQGMVDRQLFEEMMLSGLIHMDNTLSASNAGEQLRRLAQAPYSSLVQTTSLGQAMTYLLEGQIILMLDGVRNIHVFMLRKIDKRTISEPQNEAVIRGPREAFVEDLEMNLTMIRRRIKHPALKTERITLGRLSNTYVVIMYMDNICKKTLVDELKARLSRIDIDALPGSSVIEEYIEDNPYSPFPQVQYTERSDTLSASLMEGRIAIFVDGTPMQLMVPATLYMLLESAEDYYQRHVSASWIRWIRYTFLLVSLLFPSTYVAITTFHPEMLPPNLLVTVAAAREIVPFPAMVEAFLMEISFEALREAGLRIPKPIGQTVSIIGALVIGQAAVEAGIVSSPMVIIVSLTGIASFIIPHYDLGLAFRLLRFPIMLLAGSFGLFGIVVSLLLIYLHLVNLRSFGTPYLTPTAPLSLRDLKDMIYRVPWWAMRTRPNLYGTKNRKRMTYNQGPKIPEYEGD
jgi:spore germination protein